MEPTILAELPARLVTGVMLAVLTGLAVGLFARLAESPARGTASYVVPHQYEAHTHGPTLTGQIVDPRADRG